MLVKKIWGAGSAGGLGDSDRIPVDYSYEKTTTRHHGVFKIVTLVLSVKLIVLPQSV